MCRALLTCILLVTFGGASWAGEKPAEQWVLPILVGGTPSGNAFYGSNLHIMNVSGTTADLQVKVFASDGDEGGSQLEEIEQEGAPLRIEPGQALRPRIRLQDLGDERPGFRQGWALVESTAGVPLHLAVELTDFREDDQGITATSSVMIDAVRPVRRFGAFVAWEGSFGCFPTTQSAYAFVNPSEEATANVAISLNTGLATGQERTFRRLLEIPPRGRVAMFLSELLPDLFPQRDRNAPCIALFNQPSAILEISSDIPIGAGALDVNLRSGQFVNLPVVAR